MKKLENEMSQLRQHVVDMGNLAEQMVGWAIEALTSSNRESLFSSIETGEKRLDKMQLDVDKEAIRILTVYSPVAGDLRFVLSVSRITSSLERIGDHAVNMSESIQLMVSKTKQPVLPHIHRMASVVREMLSDALNAFLQSDIRRAQATIAADDMVDALNDQIVEEVLDDDMLRAAVHQPGDMAAGLAQLLIARSLERIADQSTNVGEEIVYMVRGEDIRHTK